MKNIKNFILEKLKINHNTKINNSDDGLRDLSSVSIPNALHQDLYATPGRESEDIKDKKKLLFRWRAAIELNWIECAKVFRQGIIDRGYYTGDELDAYILKKYNSTYKNSFKNIKDGVEKYLQEYNVKYN